MSVPTIEIDFNLLGEALIGVAALVAVAFIANLLVKTVLLRLFWRVLQAIDVALPQIELHHLRPVTARISNVVPAIIIARGIPFVPHLPDGMVIVTQNVCSAFILLTLARAVSAALDIGNSVYMQRPNAGNRPIKGYIQLLKILLFVGTALLIAATLMDQSPLLLLSGLGAMAAVLMLVFKDTILSLVASVQLTSNDMLRVGDWIEMPQLNADGDVIDIALHTVKVQNWDKTITTVPTHRLISDSFKNWRGMQESGGRRIRRPLLIDQHSVRFLEPEDVERLSQFALIAPYLTAKKDELSSWNEGKDVLNSRHLTNVGTFRAYVEAYLKAHPRINQQMTLLVRQLQPTAEGLPIELYCFTDTTAWNDYEAIQADIFDHLLALLPEFGLWLYQQPSGADLRRIVVREPA